MPATICSDDFLRFPSLPRSSWLIWKSTDDGEERVDRGTFARLASASCWPAANGLQRDLVVLNMEVFGLHMMIFIAGIQNIRKRLSKLARMDGRVPPGDQLVRQSAADLLMIRLSDLLGARLGQLFDLIIR